MKKFLILAVVLIFSQAVFGQAKYKVYGNARFGYSISYPANLLAPQGEAANGDGQAFLSSDKNTEMRVWGNFNALFRTVKEQYEEDIKTYGAADVTYKALLKNGYVISGVKGDRIFYQKTLFSGREKDAGAVFYTFTIEYKKSESGKFDSIVQQISKSFKFNPNAGA